MRQGRGFSFLRQGFRDSAFDPVDASHLRVGIGQQGGNCSLCLSLLDRAIVLAQAYKGKNAQVIDRK